MCGIAGVLSPTGAAPQPEVLSAMAAAIAHRGPDGEGNFVREGIGLVHRRLSIIDLAGGHQPMANETDDVWTVFNGEIYNYLDLRRTLETRGHVFTSRSDTEVIVHAYEEWGPDCVARFRGMFAFAVADFRTRRLMLARDHLGIKPLCYRRGSRYISFASELNALLCAEREQPAIRPQSLEYFLRYRYIPAPDSIYEGVYKLPPATYQVLDFSGNVLVQREYWKLEFSPDESPTDDQWLEAFGDVLRESVQAHLVADVPFGAFLSGGVDSTLVVMEMSRLMDRPVQAFSIGFDEEAHSELSFAREAADKLGVDLHTEVVRPDVVSVLEELFSHYGEPFADTSAVPTWCVSRLARRHVPMVLSGDGGDEAFAGYQRYEAWMQDTFWAEVSRIASHPRRALKRVLRAMLGSQQDALTNWQQGWIFASTSAARRKWLRPEWRRLVDAPCPAFEHAAAAARRGDRLARVQHLDICTYLPGDILTKVDIASMCHGLESRTPLTDVRVMEFAARLPLRLRRAETRGGRQVLKALPKRHLATRFESDFVHRSKQGFGIPETEWMQRGSPIRTRLEDLLASPGCELFDYVSRPQVEAQLKQFDADGRSALHLWLLFSLASWWDQRTRRCATPASSRIAAHKTNKHAA